MLRVMSGSVMVQGASLTSDVSEFGAPKKIFFIAISEYPAVRAVAMIPNAAITNRYSDAVSVARTKPPWKRKNSERNPLVEGRPARVRDPMNAAVGVIGILVARPPILLRLLSPRTWSMTAPTTMKRIPLAGALLTDWEIEPETPN